MKRYRVWFNQVNYSCVDVTAKNNEDAIEKAYKKWRRNVAHTTPHFVKQIDEKED